MEVINCINVLTNHICSRLSAIAPFINTPTLPTSAQYASALQLISLTKVIINAKTELAPFKFSVLVMR